ncbi:ankyrin repeat-containing domain protein [Geopyxis carbonaria]|nr:ankyrin repeat-containing domain protein [Geopyxis carbonaria]
MIKNPKELYTAKIQKSITTLELPSIHRLKEYSSRQEHEVPSGTLYSATLPISKAPGKDKIRFPAMPLEESSNGGFCCTICKKNQRKIKTEWEWKKHVFTDIQPYICLEANCPSPARSYGSTTLWKQHYLARHPGVKYEICPLRCDNNIRFSGDEWYKHICEHLREIRLMALPPSLRKINESYEDLENESETCRHSLGSSGDGNDVITKPSPQNFLKKHMQTAEKFEKEEFLSYWRSKDLDYAIIRSSSNDKLDLVEPNITMANREFSPKNFDDRESNSHETLPEMSVNTDVGDDPIKTLKDIISTTMKEDCDILKLILTWVVWAMCPLTLNELRCAIFVVSETDITPTVFLNSKRIEKIERAVRLVPLLEIKQDHTVHLINRNSMIPRILASTDFGSPTESPFQLAIRCLDYLYWMKVEDKFLEYAAIHWIDHVRQLDDKLQQDPTLCTTFRKFAASENKINRAYQIYLTISKKQKFIHTSSLQIASSFGVVPFVVEILRFQGAVDINAPGGKYGSAIQAAVINGHEKVVEVLLDHNADIKIALCTAAYSGNATLVRLLIDRGANIDPNDHTHGGALCVASSLTNGEEIVRLLLDSKADVDVHCDEFISRLCAEAILGDLGNKEDVENLAVDLDGLTPLHLATRSRNKTVALLLLQRGAKISAAGRVGDTPLHLAVRNRDKEMVTLLITYKGVDTFSFVGHNRYTPLHVAVDGEHEDIVQLLLSLGADIKATDLDGNTPLHYAALSGNPARWFVVLLMRERTSRLGTTLGETLYITLH